MKKNVHEKNVFRKNARRWGVAFDDGKLVHQLVVLHPRTLIMLRSEFICKVKCIKIDGLFLALSA